MNQKFNISAINVPTGSLTIFPINLIYGEIQLLLSAAKLQGSQKYSGNCRTTNPVIKFSDFRPI